jgi:hypothetical protein
MELSHLERIEFNRLTIESVTDAIKNQQEDTQFSIKSYLTSIEKLAKMILAFMNGESEHGYIFIGIAKLPDGRPNIENLSSVTFSEETTIKTMELEKRPSIRCHTFHSFKDILSDFLENNTVPAVIMGEETYRIREVTDAENTTTILALDVIRHPGTLIQYKGDSKFYCRKKIHYDYKTVAMDGPDILDKFYVRYFNQLNMMKPVYYDAVPLMPELSLLFDMIYFNHDLDSIHTFIMQFPTLTLTTDSRGMNALHVAALYNRLDIAKQLIHHVAYPLSLNITHSLGKNPLDEAIFSHSLDIVEYFLQENEWSIRELEKAKQMAVDYQRMSIHRYHLDSEAAAQERYVEEISAYASIIELLDEKLLSMRQLVIHPISLFSEAVVSLSDSTADSLDTSIPIHFRHA